MGSIRVKSLAVSLVTTVIDAGLFALCTVALASGTALLIARWLCGSIGAGCNFTLNRLWAFQNRPGTAWSQARRYALTAVVAVSLATGSWWLLRALTGWDPRLLHLISLAVVWVLFTFPLLHRWVFRSSGAKAEGAGA